MTALRVVDPPQGSSRDMSPGDMWRWPDQDQDGRECWVIVLPGGDAWYTTRRSSDGDLWEVTGTPPDITVHPSIWCSPPHGWHGWIRGGQITGA